MELNPLVWFAAWKMRRDLRNRSRWDVGTRDVLSELIEHDRLRKARNLP